MEPGTLIDYWDDFSTEEKQYMLKALSKSDSWVHMGNLPFIPITKVYAALFYQSDDNLRLMVKIRALKNKSSGDMWRIIKDKA